MTDPQPVDRLEILVLIDNLTDSLSTNPPGVSSEWSRFWTNGRLQPVTGATSCCAHHGLALAITAHRGEERRTLLFDAGPDGQTLLRNCGVLGVDLGAVDAVVLSHGHWDHAGGLVAAMQAIAQRGMVRPAGIVAPLGPVPGVDELAGAGAEVISTREPQWLADGMFYLSGEIARTTAYETGLPGQVRRADDGSWEPDPLLIDERFVSVHVRDKGQFVFSACSHAGIVNVLRQARSTFPTVPLHGAMGGLHLSGSNEAIIPQTVSDLSQFGLRLLAPGHCTGWRAIAAMAQVFGDEMVPSAVGKHYVV